VGKRVPGWAFLSMGLVIAATQGLLIRLLLVSFSGNELSIGLILGSWMLAEALGSNLGGRFARKLKDPHKSFVVLQVLFAFTLPLVVAACYLVRRLAGAAPGEGLGFAPILWTSLILVSPVSAVHGAMFSVGSATYGQVATRDRAIVGRLYVYEALGAMSGGAILTFLFVPRFNPVQTGLLLALLGLATALLLLWPAMGMAHRLRWLAITGLTCGVCLYLLLSPQALALHRSLIQRRWGGVYHVVYERDSPYGNVAVTQLLGQYTFLANGAPILTTPFPDIATVEETVHLPLLFHPDPRRILVVGGGLGGVLNELLKYPVERLDYAELDPLLIQVVRAFPTELTSQELQDPRLFVHSVDGRLLLNQLVRGLEADAPRYDIVLVNLPYPSTLELNRFYSEEFFQLLRRVLDERGLAVFPLPGSLSYLGPGMRDLNLMLRNGLLAIFANVHPIPGDTTLWLASPSLPLASTSLPDIVAAWQQRALDSRFITAGHLQVRFDPRRLAWFQDALQTEGRIHSNHDLHPAGVLYGLAYWSEMFAPATNRFLTRASQIALWQWGLLPVLLTLIAALMRRGARRWRGSAVPVIVATTGFAGMVCDLMIVFGFQALYGYVYQHVGLIIAAFMAGLALGGWSTSRPRLEDGATLSSQRPALLPAGLGGALVARDRRRALILSEAFLIVYWLILPLLLTALSSLTTTGVVAAVLLLLNTLGGWLVGLQFPLSSELHLAARGEPGYTAGVLYAADLAGAFLGAIAIGIALLPVLGTTGTCLFVVILKVCSLVLFLTGPNSQTSQTPAIG
jgi:spermidine synthase